MSIFLFVFEQSSNFGKKIKFITIELWVLIGSLIETSFKKYLDKFLKPIIK